MTGPAQFAALIAQTGRRPDWSAEAAFAALPGAPDHRAQWHDSDAMLLGAGAEPRVRGDLAFIGRCRIDNRDAVRQAIGPQADQAADDTDLILLAYQTWGPRIAERLYGDFGFVIWDGRAKTAYCARDALGIVPVYVARTDWGLAISSRLPSVLAAPGVDQRLDDTLVANRILGHHDKDSQRNLLFQSVQRLPPGCEMTWRDGRVQEREYWTPEDFAFDHQMTEDRAVEGLRDLLTKATHARTSAQGKVAVHLSGGLDSSMIAVLATEKLQRAGQAAPACLAWQPPPDGEETSNEHRMIAAVAEQIGGTMIYATPTQDDTLAVMRHDSVHRPLAAMSEQELPVLRAAAREGVTEILSGWGGDEVATHNGRGLYPWLFWHGHWRRLRDEARARGVSTARFVLGTALVPSFAPTFRLQAAKRRRRRGLKHGAILAPHLRKGRDTRDRMTRAFLNAAVVRCHLLRHGHIQERIENWADIAEPFGVVHHYPMLDRALVEFALTIPPQLLRQGTHNRWIARQTAATLLPAEVAWNPSKDEPTRVGPLLAARLQAAEHLLARLKRAPAPQGSDYIDLDELIWRVERALQSGKGQLQGVMAATSLLDLSDVPAPDDHA